MASFTRSSSITPPHGVLAGPGIFTLTVVGSDKTGSNYDVACTVDTQYYSGGNATLRIQSMRNGSWFTHREITKTIPVRDTPGNFMGDGRLNYTFTSLTDTNRTQMRIQATVAGQTWAINTWNEGNM